MCVLLIAYSVAGAFAIRRVVIVVFIIVIVGELAIVVVVVRETLCTVFKSTSVGRKSRLVGRLGS